MRFLLRFVLLFCLLTVVYQYSQCFRFPDAIESEEQSVKVKYSQIISDRRSFGENKLAPFNDIVGTASSNVIAYSNGNDSFYSNETFSLDGIFLGLKWQCVEYARRWTFLRKGSTFESVDGAKDMWNQLKSIERVVDKKRFALKRHENGSPHLPTNESYLIYRQQKDMPYGHVSVIVQVLPSAIRVAEQNFNFNYWSNNYAREIEIVMTNGRYFVKDQYEIDGWIQIIDDDKQLKPLDQMTRHQIAKQNEQNVKLSSSSACSSNLYFAFSFSLVSIYFALFSPISFFVC